MKAICSRCGEPGQRVVRASVCMPCYRKLVAYGQPLPVTFVDAEPVRRHIRAQMAAGLGWGRLANLAGVNQSVVSHLLYPSRGRAPTSRIRPRIADKLLAVRAGPGTLASGARVDATGTRRRIRALVAVGWSQKKLAGRLEMDSRNLSALLAQPRVWWSAAQRVRELYDELWDQRPSEVTTRDRISATRARNFATRNGFAPPGAWDDDTIDDPDAQPDLGAPGPTYLRVDRAEVEHLAAFGVPPEEIAQRLGVSVNTIRTYYPRRAA